MWINKPISSIKHSFLNILSGDLRFSITSSCNMNCNYCHREGGRVDNELPLDDVLKIIERSTEFGVRSVRLTGGDPLLHRDINEICKEIKLRYPNVKLGINTNAILIDTLLQLINCGYLDTVVVGIDYFDAPISKNSSTGRSSKEILENILKIKNAGCDVSLAAVYDGDFNNVEKLLDWCFNNRVFIKLAEKVTTEVADQPSSDYQAMVNHIIEKFKLQVRFNHTKKQYFGVAPNDNKVYFFHSHCRLRECEFCVRLHLRVSCDGMIKSCLFHNTPEFSLLDEQNFRKNFLACLSNLGNPPEKFTEILEIGEVC